MKKIMVAVVVMLFGLSVSAQNKVDLLKKYMSIKNALVNNDSKTASEVTQVFAKALKNEGNFSHKEGLTVGVERLAKAKGLEKQRAEFNDVSMMMWNVVKGPEKFGELVYYDYCPMKKTYWLSTEKEIKNPYFGLSMLTCGKVVETKL